MGLFGKKTDKKNDRSKEKGKRVLPIEMRKSIRLPGRNRPRIRFTSREYRLFRSGDKRKLGWYERLARMAGRTLSMKADPKMKDDLEKSIAFTDMKITPDNVMSLFVLTVLGFVMAGTVFAISGIIGGGGMLPIGLGLMIAAGGLLVGYYFLAQRG